MNTRQYAAAARIRLAIFLSQTAEARRALCSWSHADDPREPGWIQAYDEALDDEIDSLLRWTHSRGERRPALPSLDTSDEALIGWARTQYASVLQRAHNDDLSRGVQSQIARHLSGCLGYEEDLVIGYWSISARGTEYAGPDVATPAGVDRRGVPVQARNARDIFAALSRAEDHDVGQPMTPIEVLQTRQEAQALARQQAHDRVAARPREGQVRRQAVPDFPAAESWVDQNGVEHEGPRPPAGRRQHPGRGDVSSPARRELRGALKRYQECDLLSRNDKRKAAAEFLDEMARIRGMLPDGFTLEVDMVRWHARIHKMNEAYRREVVRKAKEDDVRKGKRRLTVGRKRAPIPGEQD